MFEDRSAIVLFCMGLVATAACSSDPATPATTPASTATPDSGTPAVTGTAGDAQTPPTGAYASIDAWLATGAYKQWHCEAANHPARSPSPHGVNRICSNDLLNAHATADEYPVGAANVKEIYDDAGSKIVGYAVELHVTAGKTGADWYWYERNPLAGAPAKDGSAGLVANGIDDNAANPEHTICVGCHGAAGSDAAHFGHDLVYTQVKN